MLNCNLCSILSTKFHLGKTHDTSCPTNEELVREISGTRRIIETASGLRVTSSVVVTSCNETRPHHVLTLAPFSHIQYRQQSPINDRLVVKKSSHALQICTRYVLNSHCTQENHFQALGLSFYCIC